MYLYAYTYIMPCRYAINPGKLTQSARLPRARAARAARIWPPAQHPAAPGPEAERGIGKTKKT